MTLDLATQIPVIEAERFTLRPVRRSDRGLLGHYAGDERVARMTTRIPHPMPPGAMEAFVTRAMNPTCEEAIWVMDGGTDAEVLGVISLKKMDRDQSEIGYWVAPAFWNTGLASGAVAALIGANPLGNTAIFGSVFQDNPGSAKVLTNNGFAYLGDAETFSVARNAHVATWTYIRKL
ncbi:GNAT family N-acetyltransferase [Falsirhodobacter sp. 20TX0035]|uniref:GNAT family N-acetyltransferase n=1 Tax=Falsirhodobacter sp. 20TX0035 TaxID=3022019 RepID=UPI00232FAA22|nr:GNAT family N-acetyltransferase [Falsirhodobacter sp. 20TX0035]MDB6453282.1 GNAT family N-acetyltransferase [Falsirhodobacter sp. 20TX0035]